MKKTLIFEIPQKEVLNSNSIPNHFIVKGKMVANLRDKAAREGILHHPKENQEKAQQLLDHIRFEQETSVRKSRLKKRLIKEGLSEEKIEEEIAQQFPLVVSTLEKPSPLFNHFKLIVTVLPPTRRRIDPPNLYPSVKAKIDGLTDAGWWEDDDYKHLLEISFKYGGLSGIKGTFKLILDFEEIDDLSLYNLESEVQAKKII
jgi:hypothetical protein